MTTRSNAATSPRCGRVERLRKAWGKFQAWHWSHPDADLTRMKYLPNAPEIEQGTLEERVKAARLFLLIQAEHMRRSAERAKRYPASVRVRIERSNIRMEAYRSYRHAASLVGEALGQHESL